MSIQQGQCVCCARKHLARAEIRAEEYKMGHSEEGWKVVGELSLAESHTFFKWPDIAYSIRKLRLQWMDCLNFDNEMYLDLNNIILELTKVFNEQLS